MFEISFSFRSSSSLETSATKNQNLESFSKALESTKTYLLKGQYIFLNRQNKRQKIKLSNTKNRVPQCMEQFNKRGHNKEAYSTQNSLKQHLNSSKLDNYLKPSPPHPSYNHCVLYCTSMCVTHQSLNQFCDKFPNCSSRLLEFKSVGIFAISFSFLPKYCIFLFSFFLTVYSCLNGSSFKFWKQIQTVFSAES